MDDKQSTSSSSALQLQVEVFFTQENYKKYSCRPSFVEYLEKHLNSDKDREHTVQNNHDDMKADVNIRKLENSGASSKGADTGGANSAPACLGPSVEFPVVSKISIESQKLFVKMFEAIKSGQLAKVDLQEMKAVQDIKNAVLIEQDEYQQFVHRHAKANHHLYNFIHPDVWDDFKADIDGRLTESINKYHRHYSLHETIGLAVGAVFRSDAVLTFEQTLLQLGNIPKLSLPEDTAVMLLDGFTVPMEKSVLTETRSPKVVSEDPIAISLARKHKVDIVISSSGLNTLLDNQPPDYRKQWQLPITVQRIEEGQERFSGHRVVFIDKPLPPQKVEPSDVNTKFYKRSLRRLLCHKSGEENTAAVDGKERNPSSNVKTTEGLHSKSLELEKTASEADKIVNNEFVSTVVEDSESRKRRATEEEEQIAGTKKSKMSEVDSNPKVQNLENETCKNNDEKFCVYNLWRFGKLKLLIRCSVDAHKEERNKQNCFSFFSVLPKLEYQPNFGHEKLTHCEAPRLWLNSYIRRNTKIICGRINVYSSELLRVDELFISDILQQGAGFNPAKGMKMVFQVFQALKRLPEAKYLLSHKSGEIHGCLYKSVLSQSGSKSSYDLHKTRAPVVVNYTEAEIPWVAIDCNFFMPWQIRKRRIPCTFPPVSEKDLAMMAKKAQKIAAKASKETKKNNKKRKKNNKGKGRGHAPKISNTGPANEQAWKPNKKRKPMNKGKLFASFYDTQPAEKESEVFAVSRRASGTISYDDLDF